VTRGGDRRITDRRQADDHAPLRKADIAKALNQRHDEILCVRDITRSCKSADGHERPCADRDLSLG